MDECVECHYLDSWWELLKVCLRESLNTPFKTRGRRTLTIRQVFSVFSPGMWLYGAVYALCVYYLQYPVMKAHGHAGACYIMLSLTTSTHRLSKIIADHYILDEEEPETDLTDEEELNELEESEDVSHATAAAVDKKPPGEEAGSARCRLRKLLHLHVGCRQSCPQGRGHRV
ncbi:hypothetical protein ONE63_000332 [Megalurothrips usitatus]|uniref:Uncharacterized protein n=1 Tax=Megalurothrips usitatus TaxID=439358 RepID=A0AAV7Y582_9NEOP|nr:hypothetical protein ONE63_000332 [Megalurothrips usitatus]